MAVFLSGYLPSKSELEFWTNRLPGFRHGPAPSLTSFLPQQNRIAGRDRYILGPASLQAFLPAVGPSAAAFGPFQTEAQVAHYQLEGQEGPVTAAMFRFPTAVIARQQLPEFAKVPGVRLKRSGPTVVLAGTVAIPTSTSAPCTRRSSSGSSSTSQTFDASRLTTCEAR